MRKSFLLVVLFCAAMLGLNIGCSNKKVEPADSTNVDTTSVDTVQKVDTVAQIIEETPMPKAADQLFDALTLLPTESCNASALSFHCLLHKMEKLHKLLAINGR